MARLARIVIPNVPHHITQRGNRRLPIFFCDEDRTAYLSLIAAACAAHGTVCLGWCLMDNHVHLILVPASADGWRATLDFGDTILNRQLFLDISGTQY
jgi:putative transposase